MIGQWQAHLLSLIKTCSGLGHSSPEAPMVHLDLLRQWSNGRHACSDDPLREIPKRNTQTKEFGRSVFLQVVIGHRSGMVSAKAALHPWRRRALG